MKQKITAKEAIKSEKSSTTILMILSLKTSKRLKRIKLLIKWKNGSRPMSNLISSNFSNTLRKISKKSKPIPKNFKKIEKEDNNHSKPPKKQDRRKALWKKNFFNNKEKKKEKPNNKLIAKLCRKSLPQANEYR